MTGRQLRWLLLVAASGLVSFVLVRRRQQLAAALPQPLLQQAEHFEIPWPTLEPADPSGNGATDSGQAAEAGDQADAPEDETEGDALRRKVSSGARISFRGRRYGPLPEALVGQYVDVETRADQLFVLHEGAPIATFTLQG